MIDWPRLLSNGLWIVSLAAALAVVSTASWQASVEKIGFREVLGRRNVLLSLQACLILFSIGVTLSVPSTLEKLGWGVLTAIAAVQYGITYRKNR